MEEYSEAVREGILSTLVVGLEILTYMHEIRLKTSIPTSRMNLRNILIQPEIITAMTGTLYHPLRNLRRRTVLINLGLWT